MAKKNSIVVDEVEVTELLKKMQKGDSSKKKRIYLSNEPEELQKEEPEAPGMSPLVKSILKDLNGPKDSIQRLAFEQDPNIVTTFGGLYFSKVRLLPDDLLKRISIQDDLVAAILQARQNHLSSFGRPRPDRFSSGFVIEPRKGVTEELNDEQKNELQDRIKKAVVRLSNCGDTDGWEVNERQTFSQWLSMSVRNVLTVGRLATEIISQDDAGQNDNKFHSFRAADAGTIYKATPQKDAQDQVREQAIQLLQQLQEDPAVKKNKRLDPQKFVKDEYSWVQVIQGRPVQAFTNKELLVCNFYEVLDVELDGYPVTPLDTMISAVTTHMNITTWNKLYFQNGRASRGMLVIHSDDVDESVIARIKQQFNACVAGPSLIVTKERGQISIEDYLQGEESKDVTIWTGRDWQRASVYKTGKRKLTKTILRGGIKLSTSPDHKFWFLGAEGLVWKNQEELQVGDFVVINNKAIFDPDNVPSFKGKQVTPDVMEVLGWLTGDGNLACKGDYSRNVDSFRLFYHHEKEPWILDRHLNVLKNFGVDAKSYRREISEEEAAEIKEKYGFKKCASHRIGIDSYDSDFVQWLISLGFTSSKGGKTIPAGLFTLPTVLKSAFLKGFFSADGHNAGGKDPMITISRDSLREQTKALLLSLGIRTSPKEGGSTGRFGTKKKPVNLKVKDRKKFFELIGFLQPHKQPTVDFDHSTHGRSDTLPFNTICWLASQIRAFDDISRSLSDRDRAEIGDICRGTTTATRAKLLRLMERAGFTPPSWLVDYNFEPVVEKIETGEMVDMYDVSVNDNVHTFCVDGAITHNSINSTSCAWRMPVFGVGAEEEITWSPIDTGGRDMEFQYLMDMNARIILSAFQMSPDELPGWSYLSRGTASQAMSEGNNEWKLIAARDVGLRPLLQKFEDFIESSILPLIDERVAQLCHFRLVGLEAETAEKESVRLQQDAAVHMTINEILERVEKNPVDKDLCGEFLLNPMWQALLDKYVTVGTIREKLLGIEGSAKDPAYAYVRDPFWLQWQQFQLQMQQMQAQMQAQQQQAAQGQAPGGAQQPQGGPESSGQAPTEGQPTEQPQGEGEAQQQQPSEPQPQPAMTEKQKTAQVQSGPPQMDLSRGLDQAVAALTKSEKQLPPSRKRLLAQHKAVMDKFLKGFEEDRDEAMKTILAAVSQVAPKPKGE